MKDSISKNQGNSRYLKSNLLEGTSWDAALAMLRAGTFPIDLNGINADGWTQIGTALNKANLLADATASALDLTGDDPTVNDALAMIGSHGNCEVVHYVGTGEYGSSHPCSLTFSFAPKVVIYLDSWRITSDYQNEEEMKVALCDELTETYLASKGFGTMKKSADGKTIIWYAGTYTAQRNNSNYDYYFVGLA